MAIDQPDLALAALRQALIVGDQQQGGAVPGALLEQAVDDQAAGRAVEASRRLVGEQQHRPGDEGAGDRHPLLLPARKLRRVMVEAMAETNRVEPLGRHGESIATPAELERQRHVFERRHRWDQMKRLKDDADRMASQPGQRVLAEPAEIVAVDPDRSGGRPFETAQHHHQARFARARRADQAKGLAGGDLERDPAQNVDGSGGAAQSKVNLVDHHERAALMQRAGHVPSEPGRAARQAGSRNAKPGERRRNGLPYGERRRVFNAWPPLAAALLGLGLAASSASAAAPSPVIVDVGDSLTAGYGLMPQEAFPAQLGAWLHRHGVAARVVNAGVSGDTTAGGLARLDWALADKPDLVILALGANDALRGIDPATVRDNLDKMIQKIEARGAKVLLLGMLAPPNWGAAYQRQFDRIFPDLARQRHVPLYPFFLEGVAMKPSLNQPDGLHPNAKGVAVLVDHIGPVVARLVARAGGGAG